MDLSLSTEQQLVKDSVDKFVANDYGFEARRAQVAAEPGYSEAHWRQFAQLGWLGAAFPESEGGFGGGAVDLMAILEGFGRGLVIEPYQSGVVLAGGLLAALGDDVQKARWLGPLMAGELQLALAFAEPQARYHAANIATRADRHGDVYRLCGRKIVVQNAPCADLLLVAARTGGDNPGREGISVFALPTAGVGIRRRDYVTVDGFRAADIDFDGALAIELIGPEGEAGQSLERALERACFGLCAEAVGAMDALLQKTLDYTRTREQFGQSLASFQALQHRLADMYMELEQARSIVLMAALALDAGGDRVVEAVSAAKARVGQAARLVGQEAVQLHGGMGVTDELDVGHYFKRLTAIEALYGNTDEHLARYARRERRN